MTPQTISQRARELWNIAKAEDQWPDEMRMAYIMGACDGMHDMEKKCHPFKIKNEVTITPTTKVKYANPVQALEAFSLKGKR